MLLQKQVRRETWLDIIEDGDMTHKKRKTLLWQPWKQQRCGRPWHHWGRWQHWLGCNQPLIAVGQPLCGPTCYCSVIVIVIICIIIIICGPTCYCVITTIISTIRCSKPHPTQWYNTNPSRPSIQMTLHAENVKIQCAFKTPSTVGGFSCLMINIIILVPVYEAEVTDKGVVIARHHLCPDIVLGLVSFPW